MQRVSFEKCHQWHWQSESKLHCHYGYKSPVLWFKLMHTSRSEQSLSSFESADSYHDGTFDERIALMAPPSRLREEIRGPDGVHQEFAEDFAPPKRSPTKSPQNKTRCRRVSCPAVPGCVAYRYDGDQCCPVCVEQSCGHCQPVPGCLRYKPLKPGQCCAECAKRKRTVPGTGSRWLLLLHILISLSTVTSFFLSE